MEPQGRRPGRRVTHAPALSHVSQAHKNREWTPEEQASLEAAIKQVPSSDPDRWRNVAKLVPGRSKKECVQRIKEIRDQVGESFWTVRRVVHRFRFGVFSHFNQSQSCGRLRRRRKPRMASPMSGRGTRSS